MGANKEKSLFSVERGQHYLYSRPGDLGRRNSWTDGIPQDFEYTHENSGNRY